MDGNEASAETDRPQTPYDIIGGAETVRRLVNAFYDIMDSDPAARNLRAMHGTDLSPMRERLFEFLSGWLGGPPLYFQRPGHKCIRSAHNPFVIGDAERDEWMMCMRRALVEAGISEDMRKLVDAPLLRMCDSFRNK